MNPAINSQFPEEFLLSSNLFNSPLTAGLCVPCVFFCDSVCCFVQGGGVMVRLARNQITFLCLENGFGGKKGLLKLFKINHVFLSLKPLRLISEL